MVRYKHEYRPTGVQPVHVFKGRSDFNRDALIRQADQYCQNTQDWHKGWDPNLFFADIRYTQIPKADIKEPWDLSRCGHFVTLAQAYLLSKDEKYAQAFVNQWNNWVQENPFKFGVNWASPMEVALRACNWLAAWDVFCKSSSLPPSFEKEFAASLKDHGCHVYRYLEYGGGHPTNHYLANMLGLLYIGIALKHKKWLRFSVQQFEKEIIRQTYDDGADYEASTSYHRFVLEIFFFAYKTGVSFSERFSNRLKQMFFFTRSIIDREGNVPLIGDNDSGRVHVFSSRPDRDHRYLTQIGAVLFKEPTLKIREWEIIPEIEWLWGEDGVKIFNALDGISWSDVPAVAASNSGLFTLRGSNDLLVFSAQPNGTEGLGNHTHNDKLSFTLTVGEDAFLIDPGSGVYTKDPSIRNRFRSTRSHNTVEIDNQEQNRFIETDLFALKNDARVDLEAVNPNKLIKAQLPGAITHRRLIERLENPLRWRIVDSFTGKGAHRFCWNFILGEFIQPVLSSPERLELKGKRGKLILEIPAGLEWTVAEAEWSPAYGVIRSTQKAQLKISETAPFSVELTISHLLDSQVL